MTLDLFSKSEPFTVGPDTPLISMWRPWAEWVSLEWKTIESRRHDKLFGLLGHRIGIHAAQHWDTNAINAARPYLTPQQIAITREFPIKAEAAIICTAEVINVRILTPEDEPLTMIECKTKRYGLILSDIRRLDVPIPCKGRQGIFYFRGNK